MLKARRRFCYKLPAIGNYERNRRADSGDPCERYRD